MLIVTARARLEQIYGADGYKSVRTALDQFAQMTDAFVMAFDDAQDCARLDISELVGGDPGSIMGAVRSARAKLRLSFIDELLIVGGDSVIPYFRFNNPVVDQPIDVDSQVLTDNPYGAATESLQELLAPSYAVARIAHDGLSDADQFSDLISRLTAGALQGTSRTGGSSLVIAKDWQQDSEKVATALTQPLEWHFSPGYELSAATQNDANHSLLYFNLHGFSGEAVWKGYSTSRQTFVAAVSPEAFDRSYVNGAITFAECCYGAQTSGRSPVNSCALKLQNEGAVFVGATGLAYGSYLAPGMFLDDADFLARAFFSGIAAGTPAGQALRDARKAYLNDRTDSSSADWPYKQKTLLQFVLFGDPRRTLS